MRMLPIFALTLAACRGSIGDSVEDSQTDPEGNPINGGSASTTAGGAPVDCTMPSPGASPIRRLARYEYTNTVRDLRGDTTRAGDLLPPEQKGNGFSNDAASITTTRVLVDAYRSVAHDLALRGTADPAALSRLTACDTTKSGEDACAAQFIAAFGARAFRRPLDASESAALLGVYQAGRAGATYADGVAAVIEMALQSPQFLY